MTHKVSSLVCRTPAPSPTCSQAEWRLTTTRQLWKPHLNAQIQLYSEGLVLSLQSSLHTDTFLLEGFHQELHKWTGATCSGQNLGIKNEKGAPQGTLSIKFHLDQQDLFPPQTGRIHVIHRFHRLWPMQVSLWSEFTDSEIILHVSLYLCECVPCAPTHLPLMVNGNDFRGRAGAWSEGGCVYGAGVPLNCTLSYCWGLRDSSPPYPLPHRRDWPPPLCGRDTKQWLSSESLHDMSVTERSVTRSRTSGTNDW